MSNVNIKRAVENIRSGTTVYTPLVEVIVNAIQAIESKDASDGVIEIVTVRSDQKELDGKIPAVSSFHIKDNGVGFNDENRDSFDTLYTDYKLSQGGKGFGRFTCLKYFSDLKVESVFKSKTGYNLRTFSMGKGNDIIVNEKTIASASVETGSKVSLLDVKQNKFPDKKLSTIARALVERLLPYFIDDDYACPKIILTDDYDDKCIVLNDFVSNQLSAQIKEICLNSRDFNLNGNGSDYRFSVRLFKFYSPKSKKSKVSLVAHRREVTDTAIHNFIPEFIEEFYDKSPDGADNRDRNYVVKAYVFGDYLDSHVSLERGGFEFNKDNELVYGVSQTDIEKVAAGIAKEAIGEDITARQERKKERVHSYVEESAPWHRSSLADMDLTSMPYDPSPEEIETRLQKEKFKQEVNIKKEVSKLLESSDVDTLKANVPNIVSQISKTSKNDLIHYIALRKNVLDIFARSLQLDDNGSYSSEGTVHDIIFPRKGDSETTLFEEHNLWIIDERLNFTNYVSSDNTLGKGNSDRPDLVAYNKRVMFRGDNEASNPVTIFEFKKPQRDDFVNPSSKEDPVKQIVRYVNKVREGKFKTPEGRKILVSDNTPFYGYVVCDLTPKVEKWLDTEKEFKPMPDRLGWFRWRENINLYMEVLSWDKVLKDAEMRNKIFFHKLGI